MFFDPELVEGEENVSNGVTGSGKMLGVLIQKTLRYDSLRESLRETTKKNSSGSSLHKIVPSTTLD